MSTEDEAAPPLAPLAPPGGQPAPSPRSRQRADPPHDASLRGPPTAHGYFDMLLLPMTSGGRHGAKVGSQ